MKRSVKLDVRLDINHKPNEPIKVVIFQDYGALNKATLEELKVLLEQWSKTKFVQS